MNTIIQNFNFKKIMDKQSVSFSDLSTDVELLKEAKDKGFYNGDTKYNILFNELFFEGGQLNFKKDIDPIFKKDITRYLRSLIGSFAPPHEEKEAICALLLSELVEV